MPATPVISTSASAGSSCAPSRLATSESFIASLCHSQASFSFLVSNRLSRITGSRLETRNWKLKTRFFRFEHRHLAGICGSFRTAFPAADNRQYHQVAHRSARNENALRVGARIRRVDEKTFSGD